MPTTKPQHDDDYVPPKDAADAKAREYEETHDHARGGHEKQGTNTSSKPHSVRND